MRKTLNADLEMAIRQFVYHKFPDGQIDEIHIQEGFDADGDEIVNVVVVFQQVPSEIRVGSLASSLWTKLSKKDFGFPIFSFMTSEENARLGATA